VSEVPRVLGRVAERVVDSLAERLYTVISRSERFKDLPENARKALAYAVVGDVVVSPIPSPLDVALDAVVEERIREYLPQVDKYVRMFTRVAEALPWVELLPTYVISVLTSVTEVTEK